LSTESIFISVIGKNFEKNPSRDTFSGKDSAHSNAFWLTHWSVRLGLHSMITEMNSHLSQYLNQLTREIRNAERSGDETHRKRLEVAAHYILIKIYTVNAIVDDHAFKTTAMLLFKKTMLLLTNIANENPELLKNIPEFLCQNINDVTGLLSRYSPRFMEDLVSNEFINVIMPFYLWLHQNALSTLIYEKILVRYYLHVARLINVERKMAVEERV
jgi:hypothetical protein